MDFDPGRYAPPEAPDSEEELARLRELLLGPERRRLEELSRRLDAAGLTPEELAEVLPEAIALRAGRDRQLARALSPTVEGAIRESVRRNPRDIATAIFPVLGPAIRKAIAEAMANLVRSINAAVEHSLSPRGLGWRLEAWRTGVPYAQVVLRHSLVYRVEQVFLVHAVSGLPLAHAAIPDLAAADADLVSGMLTAIQDFVRDSFRAEGGELRTFSVGELTVQVEQGPQAVLAAVIRGQAPGALVPRLQDALETVHLRFAPELAVFAGNAEPFAAAEPVIAQCLETVLQPRPDRPRAWLRWALPLALLALLALAFWLRGERRWQDALSRLRAEPGVVLTEASRGWGGWRLRGLRDPMAADPVVLLSASGARPGRLDARFEPYLSLDPALVLARARRELAIPPDVAASLRADTLVLAGAAPPGWLARVGGARLPVGAVAVDLAGVSPVLPPPWDGVARGIEARRALFAVGSADLGTAASAELAAVADAFLGLRAATAAPGWRVDLELVGRTDATGTDAANLALSGWRVEAVRRRLVAAGVPAGSLRGTPAATREPLAAPDSAQAARLNRSVSFTLRVAPEAGAEAR